MKDIEDIRLNATQRTYGSITLGGTSETRTDDSATASRTNPSSPRLTSSVFCAVVLSFALVLIGVTLNGQHYSENSVAVLGTANIPEENIPHYFDQPVDHFDKKNTDTWTHRYYKQSKYFQGPGHPLFVIIGGEGGNDKGMAYPFIKDHLASTFGAYVIHPEHRFYGTSLPVKDAKVRQLKQLLTVQQSMQDMVRIAQHYRTKVLGCSMDKTSKSYCPLMVVGGSYPGFLSVLLRLSYPTVVDISYASSAPLLLYSHESNPMDYYDIVTRVAEKVSPGCESAVRSTLSEVQETILSSPNFFDVAHRQLNICPRTIPSYIDKATTLSKEVMQIVGDTFADMNMFAYPLNAETKLAKVCSQVFQDPHKNSFERLAYFWKWLEFNIDPNLPCFNMSSQLPTGHHAAFSGSDWSGLGPGREGEMWDFQCCDTLTPAIGYSKASMFPHRKWTAEWLNEHCWKRFRIAPRFNELLDAYHFNNLTSTTNILFTNGLNDIWSVGSYLTKDPKVFSDAIEIVNIPNGAHHSELSHTNAENVDTSDVKLAHIEITQILSRWLQEVKADSYF